MRHFVSTSGHFYNSNGTTNSYSNTNTTGSGRSAKLHQQQSVKGEEKKEDLNVLFKRDDSNAIKYKKESDYKSYRRESRENDVRRSRDSEFHQKKDNIKDDVHFSSTRIREASDPEPWLEVGCVSMGPIVIESASALPIPEHCLHIVQNK